MSKQKKRNIWQRLVIDFAGFALIVVGVILSPVPGPGGLPLILAGLGVLSLNYKWAEDFLKNFDKTRLYYVDKYLVNHKAITRSIDIFGTIFIFISIYTITKYDNSILRSGSIILISLSIVLILSNQKRIDRIMNKYRKKRDKILKN